MAKAIDDGGYSARRDDIRLILVGMVQKEGSQYVLVLSDVTPGPQTIELSGDAKLLEPLVGTTASITGLWKPGKKGERPQLKIQ
jgi:hypothetical protein